MNETVEQVDITTGEITEIAQGDVPAVVKPAATMPEAPRKPRRGTARGDDLRTVSEITTAIAKITAEVGVVAKRGENRFHGYKYATMGDVLVKLTPLLAQHGLVIFQTETERTMFDDGRVLAVQYEFTIAHVSGEVWPDRPRQTGVCRARDSKGGWDDKAFNKCHTAARKYMLLALFQIATGDNEDADEDKDLQHESSRNVARRYMPKPPQQKTPTAPQSSAEVGVAEEATDSPVPESVEQSSVPDSGEFTEAEMVAAERDRLEVAAGEGINALKAAWSQVPVKFHRELERAKENFKAVAMEADRKRGQVNY